MCDFLCEFGFSWSLIRGALGGIKKLKIKYCGERQTQNTNN